MVFKKIVCPCSLDKSNLGIGRVKDLTYGQGKISESFRCSIQYNNKKCQFNLNAGTKETLIIFCEYVVVIRFQNPLVSTAYVLFIICQEWRPHVPLNSPVYSYL